MTRNYILVKDVPNKFIIPQGFELVIQGSSNDTIYRGTFKQFYDLVFLVDYREGKYLYLSSFVKCIAINYFDNLVVITI